MLQPQAPEVMEEEMSFRSVHPSLLYSFWFSTNEVIIDSKGFVPYRLFHFRLFTVLCMLLQ